MTVICQSEPDALYFTGECEMVRCYLPLPEPLGLPDGWMRPRLRPLTPQEGLRLARETGRPDWFAEQIVSLRFMQVSVTEPAMPGLEPVAAAIRKALPGSPQDLVAPSVHDARYTVVEVAGTVAERSTDECSHLIDAALESIRDIQMAYAYVADVAVTPLTRQRCSPGIVLYHHPPTAPPDTWHAESSMFLMNDNWHRVVPGAEELSADQLRSLDRYHGMRMIEAPFLLARSFMTDARRALMLEGDLRQSLAAAATACEALLDDLLCCLLWEAAESPEDWSEFFDESLTRRVKSGQYSRRLGGNWSIDGKGAVAAWWRAVRAVRNRVVHSGHDPSWDEASAAYDAAAGLFAFVVERLGRSIATYPRTAWLAAADQVAPIRRIEQHVRPLLDDPTESTWRETARRWQDVMRCGMAEGIWHSSDPNHETHHLVAVKRHSGEIEWVMAAVESDRACRVDPPDGYIAEAVLRMIEEREVPAALGAASIFVDAPTMPEPAGDWVAACHLIPMRSVTVKLPLAD